jgi:hypothetical protein
LLAALPELALPLELVAVLELAGVPPPPPPHAATKVAATAAAIGFRNLAKKLFLTLMSFPLQDGRTICETLD